MNAQLDHIRAHPALAVLVVWVCLGSLAAAVIWGLQSGERTLGSELNAHGITTVGTVTATDSADQGTGTYSYVVGGRAYRSDYVGSGSVGSRGPLMVGERIQVVYDSQSPAVSCFCDVSSLSKPADWWRTLLVALLIALVLAMVIGLGISPRTRAHNVWGPARS